MNQDKHMKKGGRTGTRMNRTAILLIAMILLISTAVGTTVAFLMTNTEPVESSFEYARVSCEATESLGKNASRYVQVKNTGTVNAYIRATYVVNWLGSMLKLENLPRRLESYDISNMGSDDIVASMVVFVDGQPSKKDYKRFKLRDMDGPDDYGSMQQVIERRFAHFLAGDKGFAERPDALLIDGGQVHADTVLRQISSMGISIPVFGMVKDDRHRTRALVTPQGDEIGIQGNQAVFSLIGRIQEETHRFAITYQRELRSKRMKRSSLDHIPGVGDKRKQDLMRHFKTIGAISTASLEELCQVVPRNTAAEVYKYYRSRQERQDKGESICE